MWKMSLKFENDKSDDKNKSVCLQKEINMIRGGVSIHLNSRKLIFTSD